MVYLKRNPHLMGRALHFKILSLPAYGLMYLFTALMVLAGLPFVFLRVKPVVRSMMRFWAKTIFIILGKKIHVNGRENLEPGLKYVLVANHSSLFDIVAIVTQVPDIAWFGHERLLSIPFFRRILLLTDYIPMRKATIANTREMIKMLVEKSGKRNIAIFPEGTRTLDGRINDFYRGFIILLRSSEVDILPVTLNGFYSLKPKSRIWIDFSARLEMIIHKPLKRESLVKMTDGDIAGLVKETLQSAADISINNIE